MHSLSPHLYGGLGGKTWAEVDCLEGLEKAAKPSAHMRHSGREGLGLCSLDGIPLGGLLVSAGGAGQVGSWILLYPRET